MRRFVAASAAATLVAAGALLGAGTASAAGTGTVYVVHGIPDLPVDVYVDGALAIDDFEPLSYAGPLELPAGPHEVALTPADATSVDEAVLTGAAEVPDGGNVTLAANLSESGEPALTALVNDVSAIKSGESRVVVRHLAAAPGVDVRADGATVLTGVTNPNQGTLNVPAGSYSIDAVVSGTETVVIGPADVTLAEGTATFVQAVGDAEAGSLSLVVFVITGLGSAPSGVPAGSGPADSPMSMILLITLLAVGSAAVVVGGRRLMVERTR